MTLLYGGDATRKFKRFFKSEDMRRIFTAAVDQGFGCRLTGEGHILLVNPNGSGRFLLSGSFSGKGAQSPAGNARKAGVKI